MDFSPLPPGIDSSEALKACCASLYESDFARVLLGDSFHPGGLALTERLGVRLELTPSSRVLDLASGRGDSALHLARVFGCQVVGLDFGPEQVQRASRAALDAGLSALVRFEQGDAEQLPFESESFDAVICECAFCTFPNKAVAAAEIARVLAPGGKFGLSDLTRSGALDAELVTLLSWLACIADARPIEEYLEIMQAAGLRELVTEPHPEALTGMIRDIQGRLLGVELAVGLKKLELPGVDLGVARRTARAALEAATSGALSYALIISQRA